MTDETAAIHQLLPARDILLQLFKGDEKELARFLLQHTYFIEPARIRQRYEETGSAAWYPRFVRESKEHHKGKRKKDESVWQGRSVTVTDNTKARAAFASFSGLEMAGDVERRIRGYHVAHIWERVYDPDCFTAGWNLCLMPGFLKLSTEQQDRIPLVHKVILQAAFNLYFRGDVIGMPTPTYVTDPGLDLSTEFPDLRLNLLPRPKRSSRHAEP
jgi:hypothetical protein